MKKLLFTLIILLTGIGFTLISLELFLRLNPKFGYNYNSFRFRDEKMWTNTQTSSYLRPSDLLGYEYIPNSGTQINSYGLVGKEHRLKKNTDTFRILLLGDSIAANPCSHNFLESLLNHNFLLHSRYKFEIWNAACPSYDIRRYYLYLKYKGLNYKPDMVIIYLSMNDFSLNTNIYYKTKDGMLQYVFPISEISKRYNVSPFLMKHFYLYRFIILRSDSYLLSKKKVRGANMLAENGRRYLQSIKEACENNKIPLSLIIFPYLKPLKEYYQINKVDYQIDEYEAICKVAKDLKINHLNLYEHLPEKDLYILRNNKEDDMHPSCDGHRIIAEIIYKHLLNNFFYINFH